MNRLTWTVALGCFACALAPRAGQALIIGSDVLLDGPTGTYEYRYTLQNESSPADGALITNFLLPFFGDQTSGLIADSIVAPEFWSFDIVTPSLMSWPYVVGDDPAAGSYGPGGIDYAEPDWILRFALNPPEDIVAFLASVSDAQGRITICNLGDRCSEEELAQLSATIEEGNRWEAALVYGGESLSGFAFASLLEPTIGPGLITTDGGAVTYSAPFLPLTYAAAPDPVSVPEPSTLWLFSAAIGMLVAAKRKQRIEAAQPIG